MPSFGTTSREHLDGVDEHLQELFNTVVRHFDCSVISGRRSVAEQAALVRAGKSQLLKSKHLSGAAVDVAPYPIDWGEIGTPEERARAIQRFYLFAGFVLGVASQMGMTLRWGGDWNGNLDPRDEGDFNDLVHYELVRR
ncbi:MAG: M15 family metallopeptidase [Deferrisomatales bacterium]|nr:M15 family metallopeptidase [Deferrisomatales bacterium]